MVNPISMGEGERKGHEGQPTPPEPQEQSEKSEVSAFDQQLNADAEFAYNTQLAEILLEEPRDPISTEMYAARVDAESKKEFQTAEGKKKYIDHYIETKKQIMAMEAEAKKKSEEREKARLKKELEGPPVIGDLGDDPMEARAVMMPAITPEMEAEFLKKAAAEKKQQEEPKKKRHWWERKS